MARQVLTADAYTAHNRILLSPIGRIDLNSRSRARIVSLNGTLSMCRHATIAIGLLCLTASIHVGATTLSVVQREAAAKVALDAPTLEKLMAKPLYRMSPAEVGRYIAYLQALEPNLRERVVHLARKNIGQPYEIFLLGEFPFETVDDQPLFNLEKSDCLVFTEHTYAMALSHSWEDFFWVLQRIRYRDGVIGVTSRNHYTDGDWNPANGWLVKDITTEIGGKRHASYTTMIDRTKFFKERYKLDRTIPIEAVTRAFLSPAAVAESLSQLEQGDFVNVISVVNGEHIVSHVGLVVLGANGERRMLHSSEPAVREEPFAAFIARTQEREARQRLNQRANAKSGKTLAGFSFLRLNENPTIPPMKPQPRPAGVR
jgi:hypothetical protein